jgi:ABC-type phosphate transport system substrate-binding protein
MKKVIKTLTSITLLTLSTASLAEIAIVVHPSNANAIDSTMVTRIFMGKTKSFADGSKIIPLTQADGSTTANDFNKNVLKKSSSQIKAYWSKLVFTGKGAPPKAVANDAEVIALVAANPNIIGYVNAGAATGDVKVVAKF